MGLFSRKKKAPTPPPEVVAAQTAAVQKAAAEAARASAQARAKAAAEATRAKEDRSMTNITAKKKQIEQLQRALNGFEEQRKKEAALAIQARNAKRVNEAKAHLRNATRLKMRIQQYDYQVVQNQTQLHALEDANVQRQAADNVKQFTSNIEELKQDPDEIQDALQDMREAMAGVNEVNLTMQADSELNKGLYDADDMMAEIDALEDELGIGEEEKMVEMPSVPGEVPAMPVGVGVGGGGLESEEEEIRRLERDVAL